MTATNPRVKPRAGSARHYDAATTLDELARRGAPAPVDPSGDPLLLIYEYLLSRAEARGMAPDEPGAEEADQAAQTEQPTAEDDGDPTPGEQEQ